MKKPVAFGKYLLLERVNVGGMAEIYKAKAFGVEGFERLVAVKRILPSIAEDSEFIEMFIDEAKIAVQLTHANVAQVFDLGKHSDSYFIAMEYIPGKDLRAVFERAKKKAEQLATPMACYVVMKLCEGLDYAHNKRDSSGREMHIIHRDVSPQNILVSYDGEVKIVDFGIAKAANKMNRTQAGILKGKFGYMSPEMVSGEAFDRRSDVFACGIVLYELLTGERLFYGESDFSTLEKVRNVDVMPPSTYNPRIPPELEKIVLRALAKDVEERYQTAMDLHDDLQSFMYASGNFFARKDLSAFMRKTFAEEIARETARDEQYRNIDMAALAKPAAVAAAGLPAASANANPMGGSVARPPIPPSDDGAKKAPNAAPAPAAAPPPSSKKTQAGMPAPPMPMPSKAPAAVAPRPAAPARAASAQAGMDWDDDDASTALFDRDKDGPISISGYGSLPPPSATPSTPPATAPIPATQPSVATAPAAPASRVLAAPPAPRAPAPEPSARRGAPSPFDDLPAKPGSIPPPRVELPKGPEPTAVVQRPTRANLPLIAAGVVVLGVLVGATVLFLRPAPVGTIHVTTDPPDTVVLFDEQTVRASSSPFVIASVEPGNTHLIEVRKPGYRTWSTQVTLQPGQEMTLPEVKLQLETPTARPAAPEGSPATTGTAAVAQASTAEVSFDSQPTNAEVFLVRGRERRSLGRAPVTANVDVTGEAWTVEMTLDGHEPYRGPLRVPEGRSAFAFSATLRPTEAPAPAAERPASSSSARSSSRASASRMSSTTVAAAPAATPAPTPMTEAPAATGPGTLRINSTPWSQVYVDGRLIGNTPQMGISLPAGDHRVTLVNPDFQVREVLSVHIDAGQTVTRVVRLATGEAPAAP